MTKTVPAADMNVTPGSAPNRHPSNDGLAVAVTDEIEVTDGRGITKGRVVLILLKDDERLKTKGWFVWDIELIDHKEADRALGVRNFIHRFQLRQTAPWVLEGRWDQVSEEHDGEKVEWMFKSYQLEFQEKKVTTTWVRNDDSSGGKTNQFVVDPIKNPKELTITGDNTKIQAIYKLELDKLTVAHFGKPEDARPKGFTVADAASEGRILVVHVLKRVPQTNPPLQAPMDDADKDTGTKTPRKPTEKKSDDTSFGSESNGLRCRLVAVPTTADDESPDITKAANAFARGDDVTFAVELQNVSEKPVTLLGVRYGDNTPAVKGKLNTALLGPQLFEFEFTDAKGKPALRTERTLDAESMILRAASAHELAPGKSLTVLLRPARFHASMEYRLLPGSYRVKVRYRGPNDQTLAHINKHWPGKPQGKAWSKEAASNEVAFSVAADPTAPKPPQLVWGPVKEGLQAAIELRVPKGIAGIPTEPLGVPLQTKLGVVFHVKNVSDKSITFACEALRQGDYVQVKNEAGEELSLRDTWRSGGRIMVRWKLKPSDIAELPLLVPAINGIEQPGKYTVGYTVRFNDMQSKDDQGNITFPLKDDWQSELKTGEIPLFLRARVPGDDTRDQEAAAPKTQETDAFGPESNGLRCRLVAVPTTADDESPDLTKATIVFARGDNVTFAVELKNVSDKTGTLLGVRHANGQPKCIQRQWIRSGGDGHAAGRPTHLFGGNE